MSKMPIKSFKQGLFNWDTLEVTFGGEFSKPGNRFVARAVKVPDYVITYQERESEGGGWYGPMVTITKAVADSFLIIRGKEIIGCMISPYRQHIRTPLTPLQKEYLRYHGAILRFAEEYSKQHLNNL